MANNKKKKRKKGWAATVAASLLILIPLLWFGLGKLRRAEYPRAYSEYVENYAGKYGMDPLLLYSFARTESGFDRYARSNVDARGLMQITEETFDWIKSKIAPTESLTFEDMYDPETSLRFGSYYLSCCLRRYNDHVQTAAAAYHSGWGTVDQLLANTEYSADGEVLDAFPYEQMQLYVNKISAAYQTYQEMYGSQTEGS